MERKTIELGGGYRLVVADERNWRLQEMRSPDARNGRAKDMTPRWHDTGNYF